jgi:hypothetical protein
MRKEMSIIIARLVYEQYFYYHTTYIIFIINCIHFNAIKWNRFWTILKNSKFHKKGFRKNGIQFDNYMFRSFYCYINIILNYLNIFNNYHIISTKFILHHVR